MKKTFALVVFIVFTTAGYSQSVKQIFSKALRLPDSLTKTTKGISSYVKEQFSSDSERIRALFVWEASNIQYDVDNMFALDYSDSTEQKINKALTTRKAICEGYAELFNQLCHECDIKSIVVTGFTKQRGMVDYIPHAWVVANLYNKWYVFDPTWSSGYLNNGRFVNTFTNAFYKVAPEAIIKTHMPFDPMLQFLNYPLTSQEFYQGNTEINTTKPFFNYEDTIKVHNSLSNYQQLKNTARRIEANGVRSSMILQMLQYLKNQQEYEMSQVMQKASNKANDAVALYNKYVEFKNHQFQPKKDDKQIQEMVDTVSSALSDARNILVTVEFADPNNKLAITHLNDHMNEMEKLLSDEKIFVAKYLKTGKLLRPLLFRVKT